MTVSSTFAQKRSASMQRWRVADNLCVSLTNSEIEWTISYHKAKAFATLCVALIRDIRKAISQFFAHLKLI